MRSPLSNPMIALCLLLAWGTTCHHGFAQRYWALLRDGTTLTQDELPRWDSSQRGVSFGGRNLFDAQNHVRVICDTTTPPQPVAPSVMLANGDVIPGVLTGYLEAEPGLGLPARLEIRLEGVLAANDDSRILVRADRVARVLTAARPSTTGWESKLVFRDGKTLRYRALRWQAGGLTLLLERERIEVAWSEIGDLQITKTDPWVAIAENGRYPGLDAGGWLGRLVTEDGAVLSFPRQLMRDAWLNDWRGGRVYVHQVQPAWTASPVSVPFDKICFRSYWSRDEVPASLLNVETADGVAALHRMPWRRNQNVLGGPLRSGDLRADTGFGVHATESLAIGLPPDSQRFTCYVGLDREAAAGGCVRCRIRRDQPDGPVLWESGYLRGSDSPQRVGPVSIAGFSRLILQADMAHQGRPAGADPLDIRDHLDWLLPYLETSPTPEPTPDFEFRQLAGWDQWQLRSPPASDIELAPPAWQLTREAWVPRLKASNPPLTFHQRLNASLDQNCVNLTAGPDGRIGPQDLELQVNGETVPAIIHTRAKDEVRYYWDLMPFEGQAVDLQFTVRPSRETGDIRWLGFGVGAADRHLPGLPHSADTVDLWRRIEANLAGDPGRRYELRKACLQRTRYEHRIQWMAEFFAAEQQHGMPQAIRTMEMLIQDCGLPDEVLAAFRKDVVHSFVQQWLLLGPIPFDEGRAFDQTLPPERDEVDLAKQYDGSPEPVNWKPYRSDERRVSMLKAFGHEFNQPGLGYALCWLRRDDVQRVKLALGADDRIKVWVNRQEVFVDRDNHGATPRQFFAKAELREGWNELLIKLDSHFGEWEFYCEVLDPELDRWPDDLQIRTTPPDQ